MRSRPEPKAPGGFLQRLQKLQNENVLRLIVVKCKRIVSVCSRAVHDFKAKIAYNTSGFHEKCLNDAELERRTG
jgi:hypothetical protein